MTDFKTIAILVPGRLNPDTLTELEATFDVVRSPARNVSDLSARDRARIRGIAEMGGVTADMIDALEKLEIIANFGVGYDVVDTAHATEKGVAVTHTPDVLTEEVADTAVGLLLNTVRELPRAERYLREGRWAGEGPYPLSGATLRGRSVGIMGLGRIGLAIARRLEAFGLTIAYHNRSRRDDVPYAYHETLTGLAATVDTLIIAAPGGAGTEKAVNAEVLSALGRTGILVNIGRGSIVDTEALADALESGTIQAAGLDVFPNEPQVPERLLGLPNAVLLPHVASASRHTRKAMGDLVIANLKRWFSGEPLETPVPESRKAGLVRRRQD
ncbi:2-hydroxyacid dehydrogenase [Mangrovicella endophytica]|uniref:2-hydroxyacid dehydrogenase n=1 Tax=Mangrovicella endophytica TaxID=2066697 RepID=UPI000C9DC9EB|nr:2-hydroxyacid dehydrogenase [Mangrovicella endophytica]